MAGVIRSYGYDDNTGLPVMMIKKKTPTLKTFQLEKKIPPAFCIPLDDAWRYSQGHNPNGGISFDGMGNQVRIPGFIETMFQACECIHKLLDLGKLTRKKMAQLASFIEDGLDELVAMPPQPKKLVEVGEIELITTQLTGDKIDGKTVITRPLIIKEPIPL